MTRAKKRLVEVYVGIGDSDGGTWFVADRFVDAKLNDKQASSAALEDVLASLDDGERDAVAFVGIYAIWDDNEMEAWLKYEEDNNV